MLNKKQIGEIKEHLDKAQNPIFLFDNDQDGLCSFLLLQRYCRKGRGFPIKGSLQMMKSYFRKVKEFNADYIFILDRPEVSMEFLEEAQKINLPVVWIDHHFIETEKVPNYVHYYNPLFNKGTKKEEVMIGEPVTALCYEITKKKEDLWIAVVGCISDKYLPDFYLEFKEKYPDLCPSKEVSAFDIFYKSEIGKVARLLGHGLKDRTTHVISMLKFLMVVKTPYEVLEEGKKNYTFHKRFNEIEKKRQKFLEKAVELGNSSGKVLFFHYRGDLSISGDIANELSYIFPEKIVVVAYTNDEKTNISVRGRSVRKVIMEIINKMEGVTGGGHEDAVGVQVKTSMLGEFKKELEGRVQGR